MANTEFQGTLKTDGLGFCTVRSMSLAPDVIRRFKYNVPRRFHQMYLRSCGHIAHLAADFVVFVFCVLVCSFGEDLRNPQLRPTYDVWPVGFVRDLEFCPLFSDPELCLGFVGLTCQISVATFPVCCSFETFKFNLRRSGSTYSPTIV